MGTQHRMQFVHAHVGWMLATVLVLTALEAFSYELFFVLSLVGLLIVTELTAPFSVRPGWRSRLAWPILLGLAGFAYVVIRRILALLPPGVLPW